ncbi:Rho GTPase activation protein [Jaminaea rosea]|uniref:Rho GTPase activation protein n=1 Tax=Jaminaea rosea TaxID=1569628 RepID=A0A316US54_9BASI|nr:Rho GTPase activation protein [Jaminaea rosea]PWN28150.1 Rho GTPase activation protein [Jaminaea rosea]
MGQCMRRHPSVSWDPLISCSLPRRYQWSAFTKVKLQNKDKKAAQDDNKVFGVPLRKSLKYASVAISMAGDDGKQYVWGYVPVIVAKVGLYLKENAVETEGVFRIAGSQKRMRELQETFDSPPKYGRDVQWPKYSIHDAASVLRRYLNQMPEPIIPLHLYNEFRNIMIKEPFDVNAAIKTYRLLITSSPPANQYLLLYVLDLLAVFARAADKNLMPASNLAVIFQPGMFSHPTHLSSADEHKIAVQVLEFLIEHQDHFVLGLSPPPPANVSPADLTAVSQPVPDSEVYFEPSDSDEDLGELEAHEGGGAKLARSGSARASAKAGSSKQSRRLSAGAMGGAAGRKLFGRRSGKGAVPEGGAEMQLSTSVGSNASAKAENLRVDNQVLGQQRGTSPIPSGSSATSHGGAARSSSPTTTPTNAAKVKRSRTTPTRRAVSGAGVDAKEKGKGDSLEPAEADADTPRRLSGDATPKTNAQVAGSAPAQTEAAPLSASSSSDPPPVDKEAEGPPAESEEAAPSAAPQSAEASTTDSAEQGAAPKPAEG